MPKIRYGVDLGPVEFEDLPALSSMGTVQARKVKRAQILLKAADVLREAATCATLHVSWPSGERVRERLAAGGLSRAPNEDLVPGQICELERYDCAVSLTLAQPQAAGKRAEHNLDLSPTGVHLDPRIVSA